MLLRYLTRCCFALLLGLIVMANHGKLAAITDIAIEGGFTHWLDSPTQIRLTPP